jgi:hypothetical protein
MAGPTYDVSFTEQRNRLTVAFRIILAIPHLIVAQLWTYLAQILSVIQWFIVLFTGKRNEGIWNLHRSWWEYYARVMSYCGLQHDVFPPFGTDRGAVPVTTTISNDEPVNRLTNALRLIWIIPAAIIGALLWIAAFFVEIVSWFAIVITGTQPRGMWEFVQKATRYYLQVQAYGMLMTDVYPKYG